MFLLEKEVEIGTLRGMMKIYFEYGEACFVFVFKETFRHRWVSREMLSINLKRLRTVAEALYILVSPFLELFKEKRL